MYPLTLPPFALPTALADALPWSELGALAVQAAAVSALSGVAIVALFALLRRPGPRTSMHNP